MTVRAGGASWLVRLLADAPVLAGVASVMAQCLYFGWSRAASAAAAVFVLLLITRRLLRTRWRNDPAAVVITNALAAGAAIGWLMPLALALAYSPWRVLVLLVMAAAASAAEHHASARRFPFTAAVLIAAFTLALPYWHALLLLLPLFSVALVIVWWRRPERLPRGPAWWLAQAMLSTAALLVPFFFGSPPNTVARVLAQPDATAIYNRFDAPSPLTPFLRDGVRFAEPDCAGRLLLGSHRGPYGLVRQTPDGIARADIGPVAPPLAFDCPFRRFFAVDEQRGAALILDHESLDTFGALQNKDLRRVQRVQYDAPYQRLYALDAGRRALVIADFAAEHPALHRLPDAPTHFAVWTSGDRLATVDRLGRWRTYALSQMIPEDARWLPDLASTLVADPGRRRLWAVGFLTGRVTRFDQWDLGAPVTARLRVGLTAAAVAAQGKQLIVGNYFTGELTILDSDALTVVGRRYAGPQISHIAVQADGRLIVTSALGVFAFAAPEPADR
jgi:hypothetical protein